jgi:hypothetical protein
MPMKIDKKIWFLTLIVIINTSVVSAQVEPPPPADINQYGIAGLIIAIGLAFVILYKSRISQNKYQTNL